MKPQLRQESPVELSVRSEPVPSLVNIARYIPECAAQVPDRRAVVVPLGRDSQGRRAYRHLTFAQLEALSNQYARGLIKNGIVRGTRTVLMVRPSLDFFAMTFALFKVGAVPVMIDPGMGLKGFLQSVGQARPEALVGIPLAHALSSVFSKPFRGVTQRVTVGRKLWWGGVSHREFLELDDGPFELAETRSGELAAILFTSGSTGPAKGAVYTHGIFDAQTQLIRDEFGIGVGDIDLPAFPLFALFSCALGVTCVIPEMDPSRPARADGEVMVELIRDHGVTYSFGSPAFWKAVGGYCEREGVKLRSLKKVIMAGAPAPPNLLSQLMQVLPEDGDVLIPYGATEALPVSWIRGREVLSETAARTAAGEGSCVGRPLGVNDVKIIPISESPLDRIDKTLEPNAIGEIVVRGPTVTPAYDGLTEATRLAKIEDDGLWHRMGDVGYVDDSGRLWFCGRKAHRVQTANGTMYTVQVEAIFNNHPRVYRSALVGVGEASAQTPVIIIECEKGSEPRGSADEAVLRKELLDLAKGSPLAASVETLLFHPAFPVDVRHNAKIRREVLAEWARGKLA